MINNISLYGFNYSFPYKKNSTSFNGNISTNSMKGGVRNLSPDIFYVNLSGYGRDEVWAQNMVNLTNKISFLIKSDIGFDEILNKIEKGIKDINTCRDKGCNFAKRRQLHHLYKLEQGGRGCEYIKEYNKKVNRQYDPYSDKYIPKSTLEYKNANVCEISRCVDRNYEYYFVIYNPRLIFEKSNLCYAKQEYEKLKAIKNPTIDEINKSVATIHWLIAQENPYERGNDSIASVLTKAIYQAYDVEISPTKQNIGLDFEAFYSNLDEYIKKYPSFFKITPHKVNQ